MQKQYLCLTNNKDMKKILSLAAAILLAANCHAQTDTTTFSGRIENKEYEVYIVMDFYKNNIIIPGQSILGEVSGFFGDLHDGRKWIFTSAAVKKNTACLDITNDYGSEDLTATLTYNTDSTYTLEQKTGSTLKIARNRKWVKMPKRLVFKRE